MHRGRWSWVGRLVAAIFLILSLVVVLAGTITAPLHARAANTAAAATAISTSSPSGTPSPSRTGTSSPSATTSPSRTATPSVTASPTVLALTLSINPTIAVAGSTVTVQGNGFGANDLIALQLQPTGNTGGALPLSTQRANGQGILAASIAIPAGTAAGSYNLVATDEGNGRIVAARLQITVPTATLNVAPTTFSPQSNVTVSGTNFLPNEQVSFTLASTNGTAGQVLGQAQANGAGGFGPLTLHIPFGVPSGTLQLVATGASSNRQVAVNVTVQAAAPTITVSATTVRPNDIIAITGRNFQPGETVVADVVSLARSTQIAAANVRSDGTFSIGSARIPGTTPQGSVTLVVTGLTSHLSASSQLTVGAPPTSLSVVPTSVTSGNTVALTARGFIPGETVTLQLSGSRLAPFTLATGVVGTTGAISFSRIAIPSFVAAGPYTLIVSGQTSGRTAKTGLTVQAPPPAAPILSIIEPGHINGQPYRLYPGGLFQIAGSNFPANSSVELVLSGSGGNFVLPLIHTSANGSISPIGITVPANVQPGLYTLSAILNGNSVAKLSTQVLALSPSLSLSTGTLIPGQTITVHGSGYAPGEQVVFALNGAALATIPMAVLTDSKGTFTARFIVPASVTSGTNIFTATGINSRAFAQRALRANPAISAQFYFPHGDTTADHRTVISLLNPSSAPARVRMTFLYENAVEHTYNLFLAPHALSSVDLALVAGSGRMISTIVQADQRIGAQSTIYYGSGDTSSALGATAPGNTWYLAEGYTGGTFSEAIEIMNPQATYATVDVRFLPFNNRPAREIRFVMRPRSNLRIDAGQYMPLQSIATIVTADRGVVVERSMRFGAGRRGAHDKIGIAAASTIWLLAQGNTAGNRQTFLTILNPNQAAPAAVTATFFDSKGRPVGARTTIVNPLRRGNIKINDVLPTADVAVVLTSNVPVVVERPQYEGPADLGQALSGSDVFGRNGGASTWTFPGGSTANGNQEQLYLFNPGLRTVNLSATFYTVTGATIQQIVSLAPNSRTTLNVNAVTGLPPAQTGAVLSTTNGQPFIAEQSVVNSALRQSSSTEGIAQ